MKKILILLLISFIIVGCSFGGKDNKNLDNSIQNITINQKENNINKETKGNYTIETESNKNYSFEELYNELIIKNSLGNKWDKNTFKIFVGFFNNDKFLLEKYYFFNGYYSIKDDGELIKGKGIYFSDSKIEVLKSLKKYNIFNLKKYEKSIDIINDFSNIFPYTKDTELKTRYYFYNNKKDYFFTLNTLNDINGACLLVSGKIKFFKEANKGHIENDGNLNLLDYKKIPEQLQITDNEYNKFLKTNNKINNRLLVYKGLYKIVSEYINSNFDNKYKKLFYKKFDKQLSIYYGFSEYTLYFAMKKHDGEMIKGFCDEFNKQYFLAK